MRPPVRMHGTPGGFARGIAGRATDSGIGFQHEKGDLGLKSWTGQFPNTPNRANPELKLGASGKLMKNADGGNLLQLVEANCGIDCNTPPAFDRLHQETR